LATRQRRPQKRLALEIGLEYCLYSEGQTMLQALPARPRRRIKELRWKIDWDVAFTAKVKQCCGPWPPSGMSFPLENNAFVSKLACFHWLWLQYSPVTDT